MYVKQMIYNLINFKKDKKTKRIRIKKMFGPKAKSTKVIKAQALNSKKCNPKAYQF